MHATVILGSLPILTRTRVGGALLTIEELESDGCGNVGMQFGAGSWPERLKGFNRFGMTQEVVKIERRQLAESSYLSFMTACHESNFSEAERAFDTTPDRLPLTVAYGKRTATRSVAAIQHEAIPLDFSWPNCPKVIDELRGRIAPVSATQQNNAAILPTFLYALREALLESSSNGSAAYAHNGETYRLKTEARRDSRSGELVVTARTSRPGVRGESEFKLWMASGSDPDLPFRIEFRPKSYLKLTLEVDATQNAPVFRRLFQEAQS